MGDDRPARYVEADGKIVYRASSLGACDRALVALARGMKPAPHPQWFQEVLDEGNKYEDTIRQMWAEKMPLDKPMVFVDQVELELTVLPGIVIRSHVDDVATNGELAYLREYKKFRDSTWPKFMSQGVECGANYPWQVSAMWHALVQDGYEVECDFVAGHLVDDEIIEVEGKHLLSPPLPLKAIIKKIARVERLIDEGFDPMEVDCIKSYPCGFWKLHDEDESPAVTTYQLQSDAEIAAWTEWHAAKQILDMAAEMTKAAEKRKKAAFATLVTAAGDAKKIEHDGAVLTRVTSTTPEKTITRAGYTSDYFKVATNKKDKTNG